MADTDAVELPCCECGNAACRLDIRGALAFIPDKLLLAVRGLARAAGAPLDLKHPTFGQDATDIARALKLTCIACVDATAEAESSGLLSPDTISRRIDNER